MKRGLQNDVRQAESKKDEFYHKVPEAESSKQMLLAKVPEAESDRPHPKKRPRPLKA